MRPIPSSGIPVEKPYSRLPVRYSAFLASLFVSRLGDSLYTLAIPWISFQLTGSAVVMGTVYAVSVLPVVLFGSLAGVLVDRMDRRKLLLAADVIRAGLVALIPALHLAGVLQLWHLYVLSFLLAGVSIAFDVGVAAAIPALASGQLAKANSLYMFVQQGAEIAGPLIAGALIAAVGGFQSLWLDVGSFGITFVVVWAIRKWNTGGAIRSGSGGVGADLQEGIRFLFKSKLNLALSMQAAVGNFGYSAAYAVLMFYMISSLGLDSGQLSWNYALIGTGGMLGSILVVWLARKIPRYKLIPLLLGLGAAGFLLPVAFRFWLAPGLAFGLAATCNTGWNILAQTIRQETIPAQLLGRVLGFSRVFTRLAMPLGAVAGGLLSGGGRPEMVFVLAAAAKGAEVAIALLSPIGQLDRAESG